MQLHFGGSLVVVCQRCLLHDVVLVIPRSPLAHSLLKMPMMCRGCWMRVAVVM
jgi:hypothetical protein